MLLLAAGCSKQATPPSSRAVQPVPADTLITLVRDKCPGLCPAYELTIAADGSVLFEGRSQVKEVGVAHGEITQEQLTRLLAEFERINFFSLNDRYSIGPDGCTGYAHHGVDITTSLRMNGRSKRVRRNTGCLGGVPELEALEDLIDQVADTKRWVG